MVCNKVASYRKNHGGGLPSPYGSLESVYLSDSDESEASEDTDANDNYTQFDHLLSGSSRMQGLGDMTQFDSRKRMYTAPTACMLSGQQSMGNTQARLESANILRNSATSLPLSKPWRTSKEDRMEKGSRSRPASSLSDSMTEVSALTSDANPTPPAQESRKGPSGCQNEVVGSEARNASKRALPAGLPTAGSKKMKHTQEVPHTQGAPCPKPSLVVKIRVKLTQEKNFQYNHRSHSESANHAPTPAGTSQMLTSQMQTSQVPSDSTARHFPLPTQGHCGTHYPPQPSATGEPQDTAMPSPWSNPSHAFQSDRPAITSAIDTRVPTVEDANEDRSLQEDPSFDVQAMAEGPALTAQEVASKASEAQESSSLSTSTVRLRSRNATCCK